MTHRLAWFDCVRRGLDSLFGSLHKAKHILHSWLEEWECRYSELDTG
ncbi:MAG: hypothetical protein USCGTAYLOR_02752 [Chromatiales bacterium USCg_Taylor]|nr:MAG: hypothetical protein USCGTAYLOR_02752 [Chromatiales bacterium USCg_Taylor]